MNKKYLLAGLVLLVVLVGGYFLFFVNKPQSQNSTTNQGSILTISASEIGLTLKPGSDGRRVIMEVTKTSGIKSLDYEVSYTAKGNLPRGAIGEVSVKEGEVVRKEIYLGTCSDVCHPDEVISDVKIIVKVTKNDGKVYQAEASTKL